jgi:hypothetical protein
VFLGARKSQKPVGRTRKPRRANDAHLQETGNEHILEALRGLDERLGDIASVLRAALTSPDEPVTSSEVATERAALLERVAELEAENEELRALTEGPKTDERADEGEIESND